MCINCIYVKVAQADNLYFNFVCTADCSDKSTRIQKLYNHWLI